jgi:hypothetical protein
MTDQTPNDPRSVASTSPVARARAMVARRGGWRTIKRAVAVPAKATLGHADFLRLRSRYPNNLIFVAGMAKSGSTWFGDMLAELPGFQVWRPPGWAAPLGESPNYDVYPGIFDSARSRLVVIKGHTRGTPHNTAALGFHGLRYLITVRDPRDALISSYWFIRNSPHHRAHALVASLTLDEFMDRELDPGLATTHRPDWIRGWLDNRDPDNSMIVRYEDMLAGTAGTLSRVFDFLRIERGAANPERIAERFRFDRVSGRVQGVEDRSSFHRRGTSGEWKLLLSDGQRTRAAAMFEEEITELGYEPTL